VNTSVVIDYEYAKKGM